MSVPYVKGSDTSKDAAAAIEPHVEPMRHKIRKAIERTALDGMTCDEVEVMFNLRHQTASARIRELKKEGRIIDSGRRRKTRSGHGAAVLVAVSQAVAFS